jgi:adenylate cyclase
LKRLFTISGLTFTLALVLYFSLPGRLIDLKAYDLYSCIRGTNPPPDNMVIVGIDEESFSTLKLPWPWPRSVHGKLIKALRSSGARGIIMDIIFSDPSNPQEDRAMAKAIQEQGEVVLAADIEITRTERFTQKNLVTPLEEFLNAGALFGVSFIPVDTDNVVRRFLWEASEISSLEVAALKMLGISREKDEKKMVVFAGPAHHISYVPYYKALEPEAYLPAGFFKSKIVLVGKYSRPSSESIEDLSGKYRLYLQPPSAVRGVDMFATPFYVIDNKLTPGIEIHANMLLSLMKDDFLKPLSVTETVIFIGLLSIVLTLINRNWSPLKSISSLIAVILLYLIASFLLFSRQRLFLPFSAPLLVMIVNFVSSGVMSYVGVERKRRYLRKAFSLYLSPQVAKKVLEDPERLKLGGERVLATVLFTDLAGFTEMSEQMEPEGVVSILTRCTTELTKIIFKYNGTLDKFIGDAVMAVWGAPAEDKDQAIHACLAALEMQRRMKSLSEEIDIPGYRLSMRIGINTGTVMAGNMGSEERFEFTVIGDHVNIASRLEGLNKTYGTEIIISESTRAEIGQAFAVKELDLARVKGKKQAIKVYELVDGERKPYVDLFENGLHLYQGGDFRSAREKFLESLKIHPEDKPSQLFLKRCDYLMSTPPEEWDGIWDSKRETFSTPRGSMRERI